MPFVEAARADDLWEGEMKSVLVGGLPVLLVAIEGGIYAYLDRCAHMRVPLSDGRLCGRTLVCAAHGWSYDACGGRGLNPAGVALQSLPVRREGDRILVDPEGA